MVNNFDVICFDAGGTLLAPYPSVGFIYSQVAARHGCRADADAIEKRFHEVWQKTDSLAHQSVPLNEKIEKEWWRRIVKEVFVSFDGGPARFDLFFEELYELFARPECWRLFPESVEVLEALKERGKKLCVISNWDSRLLKLCDGLEISHYFDFILISSVFGASKPSRLIFEEAVRRFGVHPDKVVHIGDSLEDDVQGARAAGLEAVFIDRRRRSRKEPEAFTNTLIIHDLKELLSPDKGA